jgi:hypothetical protein
MPQNIPEQYNAAEIDQRQRPGQRTINQRLLLRLPPQG